MIEKLIGSLFFGAILVLIPDSMLFMSIKSNYLDFYEIREYYNPFFIDAQIWPLYWILSLIIGYLFFYSPFGRICQIGYGIFVAGCLLLLQPDIGRSIGESLYLQENKIIKIGSQEISGDIYYTGRQYVHFRQKGSIDTVRFSKEEIVGIRP